MIKKYFLLSSLLFLFCATTSAQESCMPYIRGYRCYEFNYFDSLNKIYGKNVKGLNKRYELYASFRLDTAGKVIGLQIMNLPVCKVPKSVKAYVAKLLRLSSGMWQPVKKDNKKVISDEIIYRFDIMKKDRKADESRDEELKWLEYYYGEGLKNNTLVKFFNTNGKTMFIFYE